MKHGDALEPTLDPADWDNFRALAREMMDTTVDDLKGLPTRHAWRPLSDEDKSPFATPLPREGRGASVGKKGVVSKYFDICAVV